MTSKKVDLYPVEEKFKEISDEYVKKFTKDLNKVFGKAFLKIAIISFIFGVVVGCTFSVIVNHTEGIATDLVDENQTARPDIRASANIPAHLLP